MDLKNVIRPHASPPTRTPKGYYDIADRFARALTEYRERHLISEPGKHLTSKSMGALGVAGLAGAITLAFLFGGRRQAHG